MKNHVASLSLIWFLVDRTREKYRDQAILLETSVEDQRIGFAVSLYIRIYRRNRRRRSRGDLEMPRASRSRAIFENQSSTWFS